MATDTSTVPNNTTLPGEGVPVVSDSIAEKPVAPVEESAATTTTTTTTDTAADKSEVAAAPVSAPETKAEAASTTPIQKLWTLAKASGHPEIWGVTLADPETHVPTQIILQKYLNANDGDLSKAEDQLKKTLEWRAETKPLDLLNKKYNRAKFAKLGYVTSYTAADDATDPEQKEVFTWNIYGGAKSIEETFGDRDEFMQWRTALMEMALKDLNISAATKPITAEYDPYKIIQVHDYKSVSFFRSPPSVRSASQEVIKVFAQNYPELLKEKFFVNVPAVMGFVYTFMKLFVAAKTIKKFHPMSNGAGLTHEFGDSKVPSLGAMLPKIYGGKGEDLETIGTEPALE